MRDDMTRAIAAQPSRFPIALGLLPYPVGGRYVTDIYLYERPGLVRELWDGPPSTFGEWMRGRSTEPGASDSPSLSCGAPPPPAGLEPVGTTSFGAAGVFAWVLPFQGWRITESGGELLVLSATDGTTLDGWTSAEDCTPPEEAAPRPPPMEMPMGFRCAHLPPLPLR